MQRNGAVALNRILQVLFLKHLNEKPSALNLLLSRVSSPSAVLEIRESDLFSPCLTIDN